ncbi:hypothetical protein DICPUDRAFT_158084 [Dictyostelium purpureum]|uniref:Uncharacterized protein n=1 Tax=Dictyostelium purpureum TaxID=5786 RepID=F1A0S9_DICPU|nr:uncharacterized protein DICPUDRAFT_158084 [Dictyostelium purpureum]EGC30203.1 hypothetical protein DICPUDRAFT_158084 [Dictyostelium purpureum]|eukprot:XP_003293266.1 hypothetical protein DICPUDRAFT_158084 [Dictyostelium purpureum]
MEKHSKSMYHYRCLWYSLLVMTYLPLFILMMFMVTRDLRVALKEESKTNSLIKSICLDKDGSDFGYCEKNDFSTKEIDEDIIIDYNMYLNNNKTLHGWDSYSWHDGKMELKMIISYFQVMVIYVIVVVTIVFEFYKGKSKKKNSRYY